MKIISQIAFLSLFITSCFELDDFPQNEVKEVDPPGAQTIDFFTNSDVMVLYGNVALDVSLQTSLGKEIYGYEVLIDSEVVYQNTGRPDMAYFDSRLFNDGDYTIELRIYYKTNSGSIADQVDAEALFVSFVKEISIDNTSGISNPIIIDILPIDGELVVLVEKFNDGFGFESWQIVDSNDKVLAEYTDKEMTELIVPDYFGQPIAFDIVLNAKARVSKSERQSYEWEYNFRVEKSLSDAKVVWDPPPFNNYSNIQSNSWRGFNIGYEEFTPSVDLTFPYSYYFSLTINDNDLSDSEIIGGVYLRSDVVEFPEIIKYSGRFHYTFRDQSTLTLFFDDYSSDITTVTNYNVVKRPEERFDSLAVLSSVSNVKFSRNFEKIVKIENDGFSVLDTSSLLTTASYRYDDLISPSDVTQVYLSSDSRVGLLHNSNSTITIYDLETNSVVESLDYSCTDMYRVTDPMDLGSNNLLASKEYLERSAYVTSNGVDFECVDSKDLRVFWLDEGYEISVNSGTILEVKDLDDNLIVSKNIEETNSYPGIFGNYAFVNHRDRTTRAYDLNNGLEEVFSIPYPDEYFSIWALDPQLKGGRFSVVLDDTELYFQSVE